MAEQHKVPKKVADENVDVYKAYREPIAMPGMMGS